MAKLLNIITGFLRSFSFRIGLLIFIFFCAILITLRLGIYNHALKEEENDIKQIIQAHLIALSGSFEQHGQFYTIELLNELVKENKDPNLVMAIKHNDQLYGNLNSFPQLTPQNDKWALLELTKNKQDKDVSYVLKFNFLSKIIILSPQDTMIVGYSLSRLEFLKDNLFKSVVQDIQIAIFSSLFLSSLIVFILNRYHRRFNFAYRKVRSGNIGYRIKNKNSKDQFEILSKNFNSMMNWLETLMNTIKETSNNIAHDLRTPLSRHRIGLETLLNKHSTDKILSEEIKKTIQEVDNIIKMFNSILSITKAEGKTGIEYFQKCEVNEILENLVDFFELLAEQKDMKLELLLQDKPIFLNGDKQLITQAVFNLIDNAIKYNDNGKIIVSAIQENDNIIITVQDEGEGVPEEYLERIKEKFFKLDKSRTNEGTGLGLSLVDAVSKLHNGNLEFTNKSGLIAKLILKNK